MIPILTFICSRRRLLYYGKEKRKAKKGSSRSQILAFFVDLAEHDDDCSELCRFLLHIGIDVGADPEHTARH